MQKKEEEFLNHQSKLKICTHTNIQNKMRFSLKKTHLFFIYLMRF